MEEKGILAENDDLRRCVDFHGHLCPGLSIGFQAAKLLMKKINFERSIDEEIIAIVENDACGTDAIQVMTGCTFGKGNFIFRNYGKHGFTLAARKSGQAVRVCLKADAIVSNPARRTLAEKVHAGNATEKERKEFGRLQTAEVERILRSDLESLFNVETVSMEFPQKARTMKTELCGLCDEPVGIDFLTAFGEKKICPACRSSANS